VVKKAEELKRSLYQRENPLIGKWSRWYGEMLLEHGATRHWAWPGIKVITIVLVYGTAVAIVIAGAIWMFAAWRGDRAAVPRDQAGAEQDRARHAEEDHRRHGERLGQGPPEREPDGARDDGREHARPAHALARMARARTAPPAHPASAPNRMNGNTAIGMRKKNEANAPGSPPGWVSPAATTYRNAPARTGTRVAQSARPGVAALLNVSGAREQLSAGTCGFALGPRINAGGRISEAEFLRELESELTQQLGRAVSLARFGEDFVDSLHPNQRLIDYMRQLSARGYKLAICTNNIREWEPLWRAKLPVEEIFDVIVDSAFVGTRKPEPRIYELTLERLGLQAPAALLVDDIELNCDAARALGLEAIWFRSTEQTSAEIEARLAESG